MGDGERGHRHDVDGLRGLAIALVVVHHVWGERVSGGVDVFLTLSGFFLTLTVLRRYDSWPPGARVGLLGEVVAVWRRIARRLLPAAFVALGGTTVAVALLLPTARWGQVAAEVLASAAYVENWYLGLTGLEYEAAHRAVSPVQHFWSLSVQGQLFLLVPAVVLTALWLHRRAGLTVRPRRLVAALVAVGAAASFGYALVSVRADQPFAYYDTAARAWQPLAGGLAALALARLTSVVGRAGSTAAGRAAVATLAWLALLAVLTGGLVLDGGATFPGVPALWPVLAALALVVLGAGPDAPLPHRLLAHPAARWLGHRAYALYLWHWPLLVLVLAATGRDRAGLVDGVPVVAAALALAALTHRYVEQPLREPAALAAPVAAPRRAGRAAPVLAVSTLALGLSLGVPSAWLATLEHRARVAEAMTADHTRYPGAAVLAGRVATPQAPVMPPPDVAPDDHHVVKDDGCVVERDDPELRSCVYGDPDARRTVAVVGASHVLSFLPALDLVGQDRGFAVRTYLRAACPWTSPHLDATRAERETCDDWAQEVTRSLLADPPDLVVTVGTRPRPGGHGDHVPRDYPRHWHAVVGAGVPLVAFRLNPWFPFDPVACVAEAGDARVAGCSVPRDEVLSDDFLAGAPELPPMRWVDLSDRFCRPAECRAVEGNVLVYRDTDHVTATFARTLAPALDARLGRATGWWD